MATKPKLNDHGEEERAPRFGSDGYKPDSLDSDSSGGVYDDQRTPLGDASNPLDNTPSGNTSDPRGENSDQTPSGDSSDPRGEGLSRSGIKEQEKAGASTTAGLAEARENKMLGERDGGLFRKEGGAGGKKQGFTARIKKQTRRRIAIVAVTGAVGGGGIFGGSILQGPFQFVHLAQKLQKFHFTSNEDYGNSRMTSMFLYAKGTGQRSRLGFTANKAADNWEKKLLAQTGMKPIYSSGTRRFVGFEIVDDNKAQRFLGTASEVDSRASGRVQESLGRGAKITEAGSKGKLYNNEGNPIDGKSQIVDLEDVGFSDRKAWIKTIGQATETNKIVSSLSSRLLIKRAGVNFHPLNKIKEKTDKKISDFIDRRDKDIVDGVQEPDNTLDTDTKKDADGNDIAVSDDDVKASSDTKSFIDDFRQSGVVKSAGGAAIVVGVLCAAKQFGDGVEDYKYTNNVLPMLRMGMQTVAEGNQVMSGDDLDVGTLGQLTTYLYNNEQRTSWNQAASIRAEEGKSGGVAMPAAADLGTASQKPKLFRDIDTIPLLGKFCSVSNAIGGLPIIKQVSGLISDAATGSINTALGLAGSNATVESLMTDALKAVAGRAVDPKSKGADFGNLSNTGTFLAANDTAVSMGGNDLTNAERVAMRMDDEASERIDNSSKSMVARYFNPYDSDSAVSSIIDAAPVNATQAATMLANPLKALASTFSNTLSIFSPKAAAATYIYDYGAPMVGHSIAQQTDDKYADPTENALRTDAAGKTLEDDLPRLNDKYGNKCYGMTVTTDDKGVHIQSLDKSQLKEVYKNRADKSSDCNDNDDRRNQYGVYLGDAVTSVTAACNDGDESYCAEIGIGGAGSTADTSTATANGDGGGLASGSAQELAKKILASGKVSVDPKYADQIKAVADGSATCNVNPTILQVIATVSEKHSVTISSLNRYCTHTLTASGTASYHYTDGGGHAVDFSVIDGKATNGADDGARGLLKDLLPSLPSGSGIGQSECRSSNPIKLPAGVKEFSDTCNHLHIQVPPKKLDESSSNAVQT